MEPLTDIEGGIDIEGGSTYKKTKILLAFAALFVLAVSSVLSLPIVLQWKDWQLWGWKMWLPINYRSTLKRYIAQQRPNIDTSLVGQYTSESGDKVTLEASGKLGNGKATFEDETSGFISNGPVALGTFVIRYSQKIHKLELQLFGGGNPVEYVKNSDVIRPGTLVRFTKQVNTSAPESFGPKWWSVYVVEVKGKKLRLSHKAPGTELDGNGRQHNPNWHYEYLLKNMDVYMSVVERENSFATDFIGFYVSRNASGTLSLMQQNKYFIGDDAVQANEDALPVVWTTLTIGKTASSKEQWFAKITDDWQFDLFYANGQCMLRVTDAVSGQHVATWVKKGDLLK